MKLTYENLDAVARDCLFTEDEVAASHGMPGNLVQGEGLIRNFGFHPERLEKHKQDIIDMLNDLHPSFKEGWTFLNGCMTKDDEQWGEQKDVETLFALGCAIGKGKWIMKGMMDALPGGVPYYQVMT